MKTSLKVIFNFTILLFFISVLLVSICGCWKEEPAEIPNTKQITVYFSDENIMFSAPVTYSSEIDAGPKAAIEKLISTDPPEHLLKLIPSDTELISLEVKNNVANLNFSDSFKEALYVGGIEGIKIVETLQYTLSHFEEIKSIKILIEGEPVELAGDLDLSGELEIEKWKNLYLTGREEEGRVPGEENRATMYFLLPETDLLVPVTCVFEDEEKLAGDIINYLTRGIEVWAGPTLPAGTELLSFRIEDKTCHIDLNSSFLQSDNKLSPEIVINSLAFTFTGLENADRLAITVEGEKLEKYGSLKLSDYISKPGSINLIENMETTGGVDLVFSKK
jgi:spore germination protein GerM